MKYTSLIYIIHSIIFIRVIQVALFDRLDFLLTFIPGREGMGAVFRTFIDAIRIHDSIIKSITEVMILLEGYEKELGVKNRVFRNYRWMVGGGRKT